MSFLRNRTVIGVFCILLSVLICFGLTPLFNRAVSQKVEIVRVTQPIRAGEQITDDMVQLVQVGGYNLPDNVLHEKGNAVGKYATADLAVGDYIINTKLSDVPAADNAYLYDLDGSQQAISVTIRSLPTVCRASCRAAILFLLLPLTTNSKARPSSHLSFSMWK